MKNKLNYTLIAASIGGFTAHADEVPTYQLDPFTVIGSEAEVFEMPGSGIYFGPEALEQFHYTNINDILKQAPGVYVRDEDGFGLFPNISIRGVDTNRSGKVTLMEDGVLTAPAPYSAPAAYYSPTAGRMHALEILKGSSQIQYGPHTTGGVINYLSTPIPKSAEGFLQLSYGNYDTFNGHFWYGGKTQTDYGTFGALVEVYREQSDGFRDIQPSVNGTYDGSDETGYEKTDYMVKLSFEPNWQRRNLFEFKIGFTDMEADQTYLGLNSADLSSDPWDRYAASAADNIETEHFRTYLRHLLEFDSDSRLTTTLYYNSFARDWLKLDKVGQANSGATENPAEYIQTRRDILNGTTPGDFKIKSNDREYYLYGIQSQYEHSFETGDFDHALTLGARLHKDKIDRYQDAYFFENVYAGEFDLNNPDGRTFADAEGNQVQETVALALFVQDRISHGDWTFTPGVRWEYVDWLSHNRANGAKGDGNESYFAYGLGIEYQLDERSKLFGGYHRGFSLPGPGSLNNGFDEETSDTFELGYRYQNPNSFYAESVLFYTRLQDLIVEDSIAGGPGNGNVGDTETLGLELLVGADLGQLTDQSFGIPVRLAFTYTDATLDGDAGSENPESIFAAGEDGSRVPYVPEFQFSLTAGLEFEKFRTYATVTYVDTRFADARNSSSQLNTDNNPDARFGKLDSYVTVDLAAYYQLTEDLEIFAKATNLFEEEYVSSRIPQGPRSGAPRLFSAGFNYRF